MKKGRGDFFAACIDAKFGLQSQLKTLEVGFCNTADPHVWL